MPGIDVEQVKSVRLFSHVSGRHLPMLMQAASLRHFPSHALLFAEGQEPQSLYTLVEGLVELFGEHRGRRSTIDVLRPVKTFLVASIVCGQPYCLSARTLAPSQLLVVPAKIIRELISKDAACARDGVGELAADHLGTLGGFKNHRLRTSIERLAYWMLRFDLESGHTGRFALPYDKRTLAAVLGMSPENLSRNLAVLNRAGVTMRGRNVAVHDLSALAKITGTALDREGRPRSRP